ncbi:MAG: alpha/beta fold hydrolase [Polyangiales bacterium]
MKSLPVLLLPGLDGTGQMFERLVASAPAEVTPHVVSYPTHEVRTYVGLEPIVERSFPASGPFVIVAESFAGPLALRVAAKRPPGLVAVVLVATFVRAPVPGWMQHLRFLLGRSFFSVPPPAFVLRALLAGWDADDELVEAFQASIGSVHPAVTAARVRAVLDVDVTEQLVECPVPLLYIRAEDEALLRAGIAEELRERRPDLELASLPGPHLVLQRHPREAWEVMRRLFARLPISESAGAG